MKKEYPKNRNFMAHVRSTYLNALYICAALILCILYLIYHISKRKFNYWHNKKVPYAKPLPFLGNYGPYILQREYSGHVVQKLCKQFPQEPCFGAFFGTEPVLIVQDPEMLKLIFTKDFYYFSGREVSDHTKKEVITQNMFFTGGDTWKMTRQALTPLFSSAKIRNMFYLIEKCARALEDLLDYETSITDVIEARELMARYTMDCISSCAFGVESNTMGRDTTNNPFKLMAHEIFNPSSYRGFKAIFRAIWPTMFYGLGFQTFPPSVPKFFKILLSGVFESRQYKPSSRNDFVDLMLDLKKENHLVGDSMRKSKSGDDKKVVINLDNDFLVAQCTLFYAAGFETSATTLSFLLYEFAKNPKAQTRAIEEIDEYLRRHSNKLNYDCVSELPYLKACIYETLRFYPIIGNLTREVMEKYTFPNGLQVEKGIRVHIPVYSMHHNPEYFPEPGEFQPERFLPEAMKKVQQYTYFPFGEGLRLCIGKRFSEMQVLPGVVTFLKKYRVELAEGMSRTVALDPRAMLIQPLSTGLHLKVTVRDGWRDRMLA